MTREDAIAVLQESKRQNEIMSDDPNTFFASKDVVKGQQNARKRIEALDMAIHALRAQQEQERNEPLTLKELRQMDGEPVWVVNVATKKCDGFHDEWALVSAARRNVESVSVIYHFENYGEFWLAYRRKPEEGEVHE